MSSENCVRLPNTGPINGPLRDNVSGIYCGTYLVTFANKPYVVDMYTDYLTVPREWTKVYSVFPEGDTSHDRIATDFIPYRDRTHRSNQWIEAHACFKDILINDLWWSLANKP